MRDDLRIYREIRRTTLTKMGQSIKVVLTKKNKTKEFSVKITQPNYKGGDTAIGVANGKEFSCYFNGSLWRAFQI